MGGGGSRGEDSKECNCYRGWPCLMCVPHTFPLRSLSLGCLLDTWKDTWESLPQATFSHKVFQKKLHPGSQMSSRLWSRWSIPHLRSLRGWSRFSSIKKNVFQYTLQSKPLYIVSSGSSMVVHVVKHIFYILFCGIFYFFTFCFITFFTFGWKFIKKM